ncbi:MAG: glycosyltransferase family 4 protein [Acidobacteriota bacterium]
MNGEEPRPLTIVQVTAAPTISVEHLLLDGMELAARRHHVILVARPRPSLNDRCVEDGVVHVPMALRSRFDVNSLQRLVRLVRSQRADAVVAEGGPCQALCAVAARLGGSGRVIHALDTTAPPDWLDRWALRSRRHTVLASCTAVGRMFAGAPAVGTRLSTIVRPAPVDWAARRDTDARQRARARLGLPWSGHVVVQFGTNLWQGWKELLQAATRLGRDHPDVGVVLADCPSPRQKQVVLRVAAELGLASRTAVVLARDGVEDPMAAADIVTDASWAVAGSGVSLLDAMASGIPVVATTVGGFPELIESGLTGVLVPPRDSVTLAAALGRLVREREFAASVSAQATRRVREAFPLSERVDRLEAVLRDAPLR